MSAVYTQSAAPRNRRLVMLTLTEKCNLSCVYCYETNKDIRRMPLNIAQQAIIDAFSADFDEIEINFHGGEPFLCFREIKQICEWLWQKSWPKPYICYATTNGTLLHKNVRKWMIENHNRFICGLSLDGTREMHNANRSNSFDQIDIDLFRELWPFQPIKMTVSPQSIPTLAEGVIDLVQKGFLVECGLANGVNWNEDHFEIFGRELEKLVEFYIDNPDIVPCRLVNMSLELDLRRKVDNIKWCGTGTNMISIGMDGAKYPCHMFMPSTEFSEEASRKYVCEIFTALASPTSYLIDEKCKLCPVLTLCPTCYGMNFRESGSVAKRNRSSCRFTKIRAKASAYFLASVLEKRDQYMFLRGKNDREIYQIIDSIELINQSIVL